MSSLAHAHRLTAALDRTRSADDAPVLRLRGGATDNAILIAWTDDYSKALHTPMQTLSGNWLTWTTVAVRVYAGRHARTWPREVRVGENRSK